jgi:hypothetical protein
MTRRIEAKGQAYVLLIALALLAGLAVWLAPSTRPARLGSDRQVRPPSRGKLPGARKCRWNGHNFADPGFLAMAALNGILEPPSEDRNTLARRAGSGGKDSRGRCVISCLDSAPMGDGRGR